MRLLVLPLRQNHSEEIAQDLDNLGTANTAPGKEEAAPAAPLETDQMLLAVVYSSKHVCLQTQP